MIKRSGEGRGGKISSIIDPTKTISARGIREIICIVFIVFKIN